MSELSENSIVQILDDIPSSIFDFITIPYGTCATVTHVDKHPDGEIIGCIVKVITFYYWEEELYLPVGDFEVMDSEDEDLWDFDIGF